MTYQEFNDYFSDWECSVSSVRFDVSALELHNKPFPVFNTTGNGLRYSALKVVMASEMLGGDDLVPVAQNFLKLLECHQIKTGLLGRFEFDRGGYTHFSQEDLLAVVTALYQIRENVASLEILFQAREHLRTIVDYLNQHCWVYSTQKHLIGNKWPWRDWNAWMGRYPLFVSSLLFASEGHDGLKTQLNLGQSFARHLLTHPVNNHDGYINNYLAARVLIHAGWEDALDFLERFYDKWGTMGHLQHKYFTSYHPLTHWK